MAPLPTPLAGAAFNLNFAGLAGFFGGDEALCAMATVHLYEGRRWLGWFNSPGSYTIAKRFGRMANSRFWDGLFPGPNDPPAVFFGLDGMKGPIYIGALSGMTMDTGHLGYLTMKRSRQVGVDSDSDIIGTKQANPVEIGYLAMNPVDYSTPVQRLPLQCALLGLIPIIVSIVTCIMCALVYDWVGFSTILLGIISSGLASVIIGEGRPFIKSVEPAPGAPLGHGILMGVDGVLVIKGEERDVNVVTKGRFDLATGKRRGQNSTRPEEGRVNGPRQEDGGNGDWGNYPMQQFSGAGSVPEREINGGGDAGRGTGGSEQGHKPKYHAIGLYSLFLLLVQLLVQFILIPQGTLFGQTMFLVSLGVSWVYNSYLSSLEMEKIQTRLLFRWLKNPTMLQFRAGTRTTMAVFVCLLLFHGVERTSSLKVDTDRRLMALYWCLPNDAHVWRLWRKKVAEQVLNIDEPGLVRLEVDEADPEIRELDEESKALLETLLNDARDAINKYLSICGNLPKDSSSKRE